MDAAAAGTVKGICQKCNGEIEANAIACPKCGAQTVKTDPKMITLTTGQKMAAAIFIINGIFLILEVFLIKGTESSSIRSGIVNIVLGAFLFSGRSAALTWAKIGTIIGGVVFTSIYYFVNHDIFMTIVQFLFSLSLVGLLFGKAGIIRLVLCGLFALGYFGLECLGLFAGDSLDETAPVEQSAPAE